MYRRENDISLEDLGLLKIQRDGSDLRAFRAGTSLSLEMLPLQWDIGKGHEQIRSRRMRIATLSLADGSEERDPGTSVAEDVATRRNYSPCQ